MFTKGTIVGLLVGGWVATCGVSVQAAATERGTTRNARNRAWKTVSWRGIPQSHPLTPEKRQALSGLFALSSQRRVLEKQLLKATKAYQRAHRRAHEATAMSEVAGMGMPREKAERRNRAMYGRHKRWDLLRRAVLKMNEQITQHTTTLEYEWRADELSIPIPEMPDPSVRAPRRTHDYQTTNRLFEILTNAKTAPGWIAKLDIMTDKLIRLEKKVLRMRAKLPHDLAMLERAVGEARPASLSPHRDSRIVDGVAAQYEARVEQVTALQNAIRENIATALQTSREATGDRKPRAVIEEAQSTFAGLCLELPKDWRTFFGTSKGTGFPR